MRGWALGFLCALGAGGLGLFAACGGDDNAAASDAGAEASAGDDGGAACTLDTTSDIKNCGACGHACPTYGGRAPICAAGKCVDPGCDDPDAGVAECNQNPDDGCETQIAGGDAKNCGACAHDCLGTACSAGVCGPVVLATNQKDPFGVAVAGSYVYFTSGDGVSRAPLDGSGPKPGVDAGVDGGDSGAQTGATVVAPGLKSAHGIAADATDVYVAVEGAGGTTDGSIVKIGQTTPAPTPIATGRNRPRVLVLDGTDVFFTEVGTLNTGAITKVGKNGSGLVQLATAVDRPESLAVDATTVYFTTYTGVSKVARTGGAATQIATVSGAKGIAVLGGAIYVTDDVHVLRMDTNGGGRTTIATAKAPVALLVDGPNLYVSEYDRVRKGEISGACPSCMQLVALGELSGVLDDISSLAVSGSYLVYASPYGSTVRKVAK